MSVAAAARSSPELRLAGGGAIAIIAVMPAASDPGLLYTALMLRKLHEARPFGRVLDAGIEGRHRLLLEDHLPGAVWIGLADLWAPVLGDIRLRRRPDGRLEVEDPRLAVAGRCGGVDLALLEDQFDDLEPDQAALLAGRWLERASLVKVSLSAVSPASAELPGLCARFAADGRVVCCLSADAVRSRQAARLHEVLPAMVARLTGAP